MKIMAKIIRTKAENNGENGENNRNNNEMKAAAAG